MKTNVLFILICFALNTTLFATDQVVTNNDNSGSGSLRQAIVDAGDGDEITFNLASGNETITISSEISISESLTINGSNESGSGVDVTVQVTSPGTSTFRVFNINAIGKTITIENMTIKGGDISGESGNDSYGGGIAVFAGSLYLDIVIVSGSKSRYGGGVFADSGGNIYINRSTINNNETTYSGGGIRIASSANSNLEITNSTISNNTSDDYGGGVSVGTGNNSVSISNTTISNNVSSGYGGGVSLSSSSTLESVTISNNHTDNNDNSSTETGGGLYIYDGIQNLKNCLIANNYNGSGTATGDDLSYREGTVTDNGYNVVKHQSPGQYFNDNTSIIFDADYWRLIVTYDPPLDNQTLDLASGLSYSGGYTETVAVTGGGFLTEAEGYGSTTKITDQRGYYRTSSAITRGAYQYNGVVAKIGSGTS